MRLFRPTLILCCLLFAMAPAAAHADVDKEVVEKLKPYVTQASEAEQAAAKQAAMLAQGFWTSTKETEALEAGLTADDEDTRLSAAIAIYMVKGSRGDDALLKELRARTALYEALRDRVSLLKDDDELPILKELAQDAKAPMLRGLTRYMATHQGPIWEMLTEWAQDSKETPRRKMALEAIVAAATHPEAVAQAAVLAKHDDPAVQQIASVLVTKLRDVRPSENPKLVAILKTLAGSKDPAIKTDAITSLLTLNQRDAVGMSLTFAASTDDASRRSTLLEAARDAARRGVAPKMAQVKPLMALELEEVDTTTVYQLAAATGDDEILSKLRTFFGSNTYSERLLAVRALPYSGDKGAAKTLSSSLFEGKSDMRIASARGLAVMGESSTLSAIQKALGRDRNPEVKLALIDALGAIGTTGALRILRFQTTTNDPKIKQAIIAAIRTSENKEGFKTLRSLLRDRDPAVRWQAYVAALDIAPAQAKAQMSSMFRDPPGSFVVDLATIDDVGTKRMAFAALAEQESSRMRPPAVNHMITHQPLYEEQLRALAIKDGYNEGSRMVIIDALAVAPSKEDIIALKRIARSEKAPRVAHHATWRLAAHPSKDLEATYRGLLTGADPILKGLAAFGLASLADE